MKINIGLITTIGLLAACGDKQPPKHPAKHPVISTTTAETTTSTVEVKPGEALGTVNFPTECSAEAQVHLDTGLSLLHHMTYGRAAESFGAAANVDPDCAIALWGQAMTLIHPLWPDAPTEEQLKAGWELVQAAKTKTKQGDREKAYLAAVEAYYKDGATRDEPSRLRSFRDGWKKVHDTFPSDNEAATFFALSHMATAPAGDKSYKIQREAGAVAEAVLAQAPNHPGAHHYIIHAYDSPPLASKALSVARNYGNVAPNVAHALHMPAHILIRLGLWEESIAWNIRSRKAAEEQPPTGPVSLHYLHAADYLTYAYLQGGQDKKANEVVATMRAVTRPFQPHAAAAYTLAAAPARLALERHNWVAAAEIAPRQPAAYPWDGAPAFEAISHFARAMGHARTEAFAEAKEDIAALEKFHAKIVEKAPYWGKQVEIQKLSAQAWLAYTQGKKKRGLTIMRKAAKLEQTTEKHPVTPGVVLPANELLGDMLMDASKYTEALAAYKVALKRSPNRFNSLYGAGMASEKSGQKTEATSYYQQLLKICKDADSEHPELAHATSFTSSEKAPTP